MGSARQAADAAASAAAWAEEVAGAVAVVGVVVAIVIGNNSKSGSAAKGSGSSVPVGVGGGTGGGILANASEPADFLSDNLRIQINVLDAAYTFGVERLLFLGSALESLRATFFRQAMFAEFERVESDAEGRVEGTGLGLPLTKRLVELHGGSISAASVYGEGSRFTVVLPVAKHAKEDER